MSVASALGMAKCFMFFFRPKVMERSHETNRVRERDMRKFKSIRQAQRFVGAHAAVRNPSNLCRHLVRSEHYRDLKMSGLDEWNRQLLETGDYF